MFFQCLLNNSFAKYNSIFYEQVNLYEAYLNAWKQLMQVCRSIGNFTCGIFSEMSKDNHGKKPLRQTDVLSYFQKAPSKNTHSLHDSSSFEQSVTEREVNSYGNAFDIHTMDEEIGSSSG